MYVDVVDSVWRGETDLQGKIGWSSYEESWIIVEGEGVWEWITIEEFDEEWKLVLRGSAKAKVEFNVEMILPVTRF